jgi:hypothetical protein
MCAWDTRAEDVSSFVSDLKRFLVEAPKDATLSSDHRKL